MKKKKTIKKKQTSKKKIVSKKKPVRKKVTKKKVTKSPIKKVKRKTVKKAIAKRVTRKKTKRGNPSKVLKVKDVVIKQIEKVGNPMAKKKVKSAVSKARNFGKKLTGKNVTDKLMEGGAVVAGAVGAGVLANMVPIKDGRIKAIMPIAAGVFLSTMKPFSGKVGTALTLGLISAGGLALVKQLAPNVPLLAGEDELMIDYVPNEYERDAMLGYYPDDMEYYGQEEDLDDILEGEAVELGQEEVWLDTSDV